MVLAHKVYHNKFILHFALFTSFFDICPSVAVVLSLVLLSSVLLLSILSLADTSALPALHHK